MKKLITVFLLVAVVISGMFAGDFKFIFKDLDQHPEILSGFLPTLVEIGVGYGEKTQVQFTVGGGYTQRSLFLDPETGEPLKTNQLIYDTTQFRWNLKVVGSAKNNHLKPYIGYEGRYEDNSNSIALGKDRYRGYNDLGQKGKTAVPSIDNWFGDTLEGNKIYPDIAGDKKAFINALYAGFVLDYMQDDMTATDGVELEFKFQYAPSAINKKASFSSASLNVVAAKTLYEQTNDSGRNKFSVVIIDRANANRTSGEKIPVYASRPASLGRKVRGFSTNSYNTEYSFVNNLDLRLAGPELFCSGIFPRVNLFVDLGYHCGNYFNTGVEGKNFLASAGAQFEVCFFDIIDLGFEVSYLLSGENMQKPGEKIITGATFFLDF